MSEVLSTTITASSRDAAIDQAREQATEWFGTDRVDVEITHVTVETVRFTPMHSVRSFVVDFDCRVL